MERLGRFAGAAGWAAGAPTREQVKGFLSGLRMYDGLGQPPDLTRPQRLVVRAVTGRDYQFALLRHPIRLPGARTPRRCDSWSAARGFYLSYRPKSAASGGDESSRATSGRVRSRMMTFNRVMLWAVTAIAVVFLFFPQAITGLFASNSRFTVDMDRTELTIDGMT